MNIAFDVTLLACVRVDVPDGMPKAAAVALARTILDAEIDCIDIGRVVDVPAHSATVTLTEASSEGEFDLVEIDGEDPDAQEDEEDHYASLRASLAAYSTE